MASASALNSIVSCFLTSWLQAAPYAGAVRAYNENIRKCRHLKRQQHVWAVLLTQHDIGFVYFFLDSTLEWWPARLVRRGRRGEAVYPQRPRLSPACLHGHRLHVSEVIVASEFLMSHRLHLLFTKKVYSLVG